MGDPQEYAMDYFQQGVDEIIYMDAVASLYGRNNLTDIVEKTSQNIFIPITVGGGIRSVDDAWQLFRSGADKVAINTAAIANPALITDITRRFGNQALVVSIEAKRIGDENGNVMLITEERKQELMLSNGLRKWKSLVLAKYYLLR